MDLIDKEETQADQTSCRITEKVRIEIGKDLNRTKTSERVNTSEGQEELRRVLLAVAYVIPDIGYCQGMNFVAGALIELAGGEAQAFLVFMFMIIEKEMRPLFLPVS